MEEQNQPPLKGQKSDETPSTNRDECPTDAENRRRSEPTLLTDRAATFLVQISLERANVSTASLDSFATICSDPSRKSSADSGTNTSNSNSSATCTESTDSTANTISTDSTANTVSMDTCRSQTEDTKSDELFSIPMDVERPSSFPVPITAERSSSYETCESTVSSGKTSCSESLPLDQNFIAPIAVEGFPSFKTCGSFVSSGRTTCSESLPTDTTSSSESGQSYPGDHVRGRQLREQLEEGRRGFSVPTCPPEHAQQRLLQPGNQATSKAKPAPERERESTDSDSISASESVKESTDSDSKLTSERTTGSTDSYSDSYYSVGKK